MSDVYPTAPGVLTLVAGILLGVAHYYYAKQNYPLTWPWRTLLFMAGYVTGVCAMWLAIGDQEGQPLLISLIFGGPIGGLISVRWLPLRSRTFMPGRDNE